MTKNLNHRPVSASGRKGTYSHDPSPLHSNKSKKETHPFNPPDLHSQLRMSSKSATKKTDPKFLANNLFINDLNAQLDRAHPIQQRKLSAPITAAITNRKNSKQYFGLTHKEEAALHDYKATKTKTRDGRPPTGLEENIPSPHILGSSLYELRKNQMAFIPKHTDDYTRNNNYIPKFKGTDPSNKFNLKSSPKSIPQPDSTGTKFKKPNSRGQQKSFDINAGTANKFTPYISYTKPPTANNSPRNKDGDSRISKTENHSYLSQSMGPKSTKAPLDKNILTGSKVIAKSPVLAAKHRKTPSLDTNKRSEILQKSQVAPQLGRVRKSADHGDYYQGHLHEAHHHHEQKSSFRFAIRTRAGVAPNGTRKINQDSFIFHTNYGKKSDRYLLGVCDGHGMNGHFVSGFVKETLPMYLLADPNFDSDLGQAFVNSFELCQQKLLVADFDCKFSGTTSVVLMIDGKRIITANAGDSRGILGCYNSKGWGYKLLSNDHKPDTPQEAQRILRSGGRIEPFKDYDGSFVGPSRVWLSSQDIPGLAMSRSLGDFVAASVGVSCIPEIKEFTIAPEDRFMIVASDGVWEFIESIDVVKIIAPFYESNNVEGACDYLLGVSLKRWQEEEEVVVDDITLIIIFF